MIEGGGVTLQKLVQQAELLYQLVHPWSLTAGSPENQPLEKEILFGNRHFQVPLVKHFGGVSGINPPKFHQGKIWIQRSSQKKIQHLQQALYNKELKNHLSWVYQKGYHDAIVKSTDS